MVKFPTGLQNTRVKVMYATYQVVGIARLENNTVTACQGQHRDDRYI